MTSIIGVVGLFSCLIVCAFSFEIPLQVTLGVGSSPKPGPKRGLQVGYYRSVCPSAEYIIKNEVNKAIYHNRGIAAGLIRLHFHDCFVRGCDGSILLDVGPGGAPSEKEGIPNKNTLRGLEVIDSAKKILENVCPGKVSCADILAFAARDSSFKVGGMWWEVPAGRFDGRTSLASETLGNLPSPFSDVQKLQENFKAKGMSLDEMVVLSGAHSIGIAHCQNFQQRLYPTQDPTIDPRYAAYLKSICPPPSNNTSSTPPSTFLDPLTPYTLDNKYYVALKIHRGLFKSDQVLNETPLTRNIVDTYARFGSLWSRKFADAMVHVGFIDVLTGPEQGGEIRNNCHFVNPLGQ